jgi:hypothetical protein
LGDVSDEHDESFNQDVSVMEREFVERWYCGMLAGCCWSVVREPQKLASNEKDQERHFQNCPRMK